MVRRFNGKMHDLEDRSSIIMVIYRTECCRVTLSLYRTNEHRCGRVYYCEYYIHLEWSTPVTYVELIAIVTVRPTEEFTEQLRKN